MNTLVDDIKNYMVNDTIVGLHYGSQQLEDNTLLFTATYHALVEALDLHDPYTKLNFNSWIEGCRVEPGLFHRRPNFPERLISHDEQIGLCSYSTDLAKEIVDYGKRKWWSFNNQNPGKFTLRSWHGKMLHPITYYKFRANGDSGLNLLDKLLWTGVAIYSALQEKGDTNGRCQLWLQSRHLRHSKSWIIKLGNWFFLRDIKKRYGDISGVYEIYYKSHHPFTKHTKGLI